MLALIGYESAVSGQGAIGRPVLGGMEDGFRRVETVGAAASGGSARDISYDAARPRHPGKGRKGSPEREQRGDVRKRRTHVVW